MSIICARCGKKIGDGVVIEVQHQTGIGTETKHYHVSHKKKCAPLKLRMTNKEIRKFFEQIEKEAQ